MNFIDKMYAKASPKLRPAIDELGVSLNTMRTNEPLNRKSGNKSQADMEKRNGASFKTAIEILSKRYRG